MLARRALADAISEMYESAGSKEEAVPLWALFSSSGKESALKALCHLVLAFSKTTPLLYKTQLLSLVHDAT